MEHSKLKNANALIEFLNENGIPAIPSIQADPGMLHWWEFEKIERLCDAAIFEGYFFLAVTEQGFNLHVYNAQSDWYKYARVWKADVAESEFLQDLKKTIFSDDIYAFDSYVWFCVRETYFEFEWHRTIKDITDIEQISSELKSGIFKFEGAFGNTPEKVKELKNCIVDLLALFTQEEIRNSANFIIMQRFFPPHKYEHWVLPNEFKHVLQEMGQSFDGDQMPAHDELKKLIKRMNDL